ncbi:MAG: phosphoadenylyl-sulfate reductase [Pseudomonadota bacterium]
MSAQQALLEPSPRPGTITDADIPALNARWSGAPAAEILDYAIGELFPGRIALVSSFGTEAAVLLHLVSKVDPKTPVVFLETEKHFAQTLQYRNALERRLGLEDLRSIRPSAKALEAEDPDGDLWRSDTEACCDLRKVRPLADALEPFNAWISGRKQFHGAGRARLPVFEASRTHIKVNPLANWSKDEVAQYMSEHDLPSHPLADQGFASIGCWPCTHPITDGEDVRAGRWPGAGKTECGIHTRL